MPEFFQDATAQTGWTFDGQLPANNPSPSFLPAGYKFETYPGRGDSWVNNVLTLATGTVQMTALWLPSTEVIGKLAVMTGATAGGTMTNWWYALCDSTGQVRAVTANQLTGAIAANTLIPLNVSYQSFTDGVTTTGSAVFTSATAGFTAADQGRPIWEAANTHIAANTTILSVQSGTSITMSANAVGTGATAITFYPGRPLTVPYTGLWYQAVMVTATTMPTLHSTGSTSNLNGIAPVLCGTSSTGQTTPPALYASLAAPTAGANFFYGAAG